MHDVIQHWALVFFHETEAILGSYVIQKQGCRWNSTFILTDSQEGCMCEVCAEGEVLTRVCCRPLRGKCRLKGLEYAIFEHFDPYMSQKHRRSKR